MCLYLELTLDGKNHVVFSGGKYLMQDIQKIPSDKFPVRTTIKRIDKRLIFT